MLLILNLSVFEHMQQKYLFDGAKPGQWQYHSEVLTDQGPEEMCINTIREKLLQHLPKEVPYSMTQVGYDLWAPKRC